MLETGLIAAAVVVALTQPVPQIVRLLRTRSVAGVSGPTAWLGLVINAAWVAYGLGRGLLPVAVLSIAYVIGYALIVALLVRGGNRHGIGLAAATAVVAAALTVTAGWAVLGTALAVTVGAQFVPQVLTAWRSEDLTGLSAGTYLVCAMDGLVWGGFGLLSGDGPLVLYGLVMVLVAVLVLIPQRRWTVATAAGL